jgi:hypothetical protein
VGGGNICSHGVSASAPIMGQITSPARRKRSNRMPLPV